MRPGEEALIDQLAAELADHAGITLTLTGVQATMLAANLQLALRHPGNTGPNAELARKIVDKIATTLGPAGQQLIELGWST